MAEEGLRRRLDDVDALSGGSDQVRLLARDLVLLEASMSPLVTIAGCDAIRNLLGVHLAPEATLHALRTTLDDVAALVADDDRREASGRTTRARAAAATAAGLAKPAHVHDEEKGAMRLRRTAAAEALGLTHWKAIVRGGGAYAVVAAEELLRHVARGRYALPRPVRLFGRSAEVAVVREELLAGAVVAVTGPSGCGASTTALVAANGVAHLVPGGAIRIDAGRARSEAEVLEEVHLALERLDLLADDAPPMVVVLDDVRVPIDVDAVPRPAGAGVAVVGRPLPDRGKGRTIDLTAMAVENAELLLRSIVGDDVCAREARALRQIVELCGALPRALCAAAAHLDPEDPSLRAIVDRLREPGLALVPAVPDRPMSLLLDLRDGPSASRRPTEVAGVLATVVGDLRAGDRAALFRLARIPAERFGVDAARVALGVSASEAFQILGRLVAGYCAVEAEQGRWSLSELAVAHTAAARPLASTDDVVPNLIGWASSHALSALSAVHDGSYDENPVELRHGALDWFRCEHDVLAGCARQGFARSRHNDVMTIARSTVHLYELEWPDLNEQWIEVAELAHRAAVLHGALSGVRMRAAIDVARALLADKQHEVAEEHLRANVLHDPELEEHPALVAQTFLHLAMAAAAGNVERQRDDEVIELHRRALDATYRIGTVPGEDNDAHCAMAGMALADALCDLGHPGDAIAVADRAYGHLSAEDSHAHLRAWARLCAARARLLAGVDHETAKAQLARSERDFERLDDPIGLRSVEGTRLTVGPASSLP